MIKVCFVCYGNICRSPSAEYIFKYLVNKNNLTDKFEIVSRGISSCETNNDIYLPSKEILIKHNIPFKRHFAKKITIEDIESSNYILCMEISHLNNIKRIYNPSYLSQKLFLMTHFNQNGKNEDIIDPYYYDNYELTYQQIYSSCLAFLNYIIENNLIK